MSVTDKCSMVIGCKLTIFCVILRSVHVVNYTATLFTQLTVHFTLSADVLQVKHEKKKHQSEKFQYIEVSHCFVSTTCFSDCCRIIIVVL